ncbi:MAG: hypothetical protein ACOYYJ_15380 [Chloroflexota bacterium]
MKKAAIIILASFTILGCSMFSKLFKKAEKPIEPAEVYNGLRNQILNLKPSDAGIEPSSEMPNVWGILMLDFRQRDSVPIMYGHEEHLKS